MIKWRDVFWIDFFHFCNYYFREYYSFDTPKALMQYYSELNKWKNVFIEGFRGCAKTTIAQMYVIRNILYKKKRNIMRYSQTIDNAQENLTYIANSLINDWWIGERICMDYGNLYYPENITRNGLKKQKTLSKFITENNVYVRAMSLGTSPRWKNYTAPDGKFRPDLLIFDDVDTIASTQSKKIIDKNYEFLLNEVLWGASWSQIIFLGNTIYEDWLVPRFREHVKNSKDWEVIRLPIKVNNEIVWNRFVETDEEAKSLNEWITESNRKYIYWKCSRQQF